MSVVYNTPFSNPENLPLEKLSLCVATAGVVRQINALDSYWVEKRVFTMYERPAESTNVIGATDAWKLKMEQYLEDLQWLLSLEHHRFWSTIVHSPRAMDALVSFLQEADPPYAEAPGDRAARALYETIRRHVLVVFCRLSTNKESQACWMSKEYLGDLIYDKFIFTVPILWDLCLVYGADNPQVLARLVGSVFALQPKYETDLEAAIGFVKEAFKYIILQVNNDYDSPEPPNLPDTFKGFAEIRRPSEDSRGRPPASALRDLAAHLLDAAMTVRIFVEVHPRCADMLRRRGFVLSIAQVYEHAIPQLYELLEDTDAEQASLDSTNGVAPSAAQRRGSANGVRADAALRREATNYVEAARAELIDIFREILAESKSAIFNGDGEAGPHVERYLTTLLEGLSERLLLQDYHACYPVQDDIDMLRQAYPPIDTVKTDFILQAIYSNLDEPVPEPRPPPVMNGHLETTDNQPPIDNQPETDIPHNVKQESLISEVKDIFPHLGDGFIQKCLEHYGYNSERVLNSILEDNLADCLRSLDRSLPLIPEDSVDQMFLETGIERLNVFDGDEFDIMTRDDVDLSRMHKGKKKSQYKDLSQMLNDKSDVKKMVDIYTKYSLVCDESAVYSDEYDDTWDEAPAGPAGPGAGPEDAGDLGRAFVVPRALRPPPARAQTEESSSSSEGEEAAAAGGARGRGRLDFCVNPEEARARREAAHRARLARQRRAPPPDKSAVEGGPRGAGQSAATVASRDRKERRKATGANHARRDRAQWKRGQGMLPG